MVIGIPHRRGRPVVSTTGCCAVVMLLVSLMDLASATVIRVPQDRSDIKSAITVAVSGDEIIVSPGIYKETVHFKEGLSLNIHSTDPTNWTVVDSTIIEGEGTASITLAGSYSTTSTLAGVYLPADGGPTGCRLAGFTIRGHGDSGINGGGPAAVVEYCHILDNYGHLGELDRYYGRTRSGGGIYCCNGTIQNCIIERNLAAYGGGLYNCDGMIQNNLIVRNQVSGNHFSKMYGAGLNSCDGTIRGNTIVDNGLFEYDHLSAAYGEGGGLCFCKGTITDNIIWTNDPNYSWTEFDDCQMPTYCCIKGWKRGGEGNIATDPRLVNAAYDRVRGSHAWPAQDYRLRPDSPCIDAGRSTTGLTIDLVGTPRGKVWHAAGSYGDGSHTDIGAYEFDPGALEIWVPPGCNPGVMGKPFYLRWTLTPVTIPYSCNLNLLRGGKVVAVLGKYGPAAGHTTYDTAGWWNVPIPGWISAGTDYTITAKMVAGPNQAETSRFEIKIPNGAAPAAWVRYR